MEKTYAEVQEDKMDLDLKNNQKLDRYAEYQKKRCESAGHNVPTAIVKDETGELQWLNRALRRKAKRKQK